MVSAVLLAGRPVLAAVVVALGAIGTAWIVTVVPTRELVLAERGAFESTSDGPA